MTERLRRGGFAVVTMLVLGMVGCGGTTSSGGLESASGDNSGGATSRVTVSPSTVTLEVGQTRQLSASTTASSRDDDDDDDTTADNDGDDGTVGNGNGGGQGNGAQMGWHCSNGAVAAVNANGLVTALAPGTATVTASNGTASGSCTVTVTGTTGGGTTGGGTTGGGTTGGGTTGGGTTGGGTTGGGTTGGGGATATSFASTVQPIAQASCNCHGSQMSTYSSVQALVTAGDPQNSLYYVKGTGGASHPGGDRWGNNAQTIADWITQGAQP